MAHANYTVESCTDEALTIRDVGPWDKHPTVTNDADWVVSSALHAGLLKPTQRFFYYDSEGNLDELVFGDRGRLGPGFLRFAPGPRS